MKPVLETALRILTFRASREELRSLDRRHLAFGLVSTWIVGMGRYWDDPYAHPLQLLGVGSVLYVFVLSLLLWAVIAPLRPASWSYRSVLTFVTLTSPPALIYATPVELWYDVETASRINLAFLALVASWRVALLLFYLGRAAQLGWIARLAGAALPICAIIVVLTALNLERAVFEIMGGLRAKTAKDDAYAFLVSLAALSVYGALPLLLVYVSAVQHARWTAARQAEARESPAAGAEAAQREPSSRTSE